MSLISISPSYREDRVAWNAAWERRLENIYGPDIEWALGGLENLIDSQVSHMLDDTSAQRVASQKRQICLLQRDLSRKVCLRYAENHFAEKCIALTADERHNWILEGLVRTCDACRDNENYRKFAPEITLRRMQLDSGKGFLNLLEALIHPEIETVPSDFRMVANAPFDLMNKNSENVKVMVPKERLLQLMFNADRTYFLTMFCWSTLLAFVSSDPAYIYNLYNFSTFCAVRRVRRLSGREICHF